MEYWIDSHCHMVSEGMLEFFEELKERSLENNVRKVLIICGSLKQIEIAIELTQDDNMFDLAVGVHPTTVEDRSEEEFLSMMKYLDHPKVVALGEIGLDYYWDETYKSLQMEYFIKQIQFANEKSLPIIVHLRSSAEDTMTTLKKYPVDNKGVIHCFSEGVSEAMTFLDMGYHLGFGGILTFKNGENVREVLDITPLNRVLTETDSPYLAPVPKRGKKNEPSFVMYVGEKILELKKSRKALIQKQVNENYYNLFNKSTKI